MGTERIVGKKQSSSRSAFRIVAPDTAQRAALEKNSGSDPRTVVNREMLYIEDTAAEAIGFIHDKSPQSLLLGFYHNIGIYSNVILHYSVNFDFKTDKTTGSPIIIKISL